MRKLNRARLAGLTLVSLVLLVILAACSSGVPFDAGPLGNGGNDGSECLLAHPGGVISLGDQSFCNTGSQTAVIEKVSLQHPNHLLLLEALVIPITGHTLFGEWETYPNAKIARQAPGIGWAQRQKADGAHVPRARGLYTTNLVVVLKPTAPNGTTQGINIWYTEPGQQYHLRTNIAVRVTTRAHC